MSSTVQSEVNKLILDIDKQLKNRMHITNPTEFMVEVSKINKYQQHLTEKQLQWLDSVRWVTESGIEWE